MAEEIKRKASVPKLDRVISFVLAGEYDGQLGELRSAIDKRNEERKQSVMSLVHEVFGDDAKVVSENHVPSVEPNLFMRKASAQKSQEGNPSPLPGPYKIDPANGNALRASSPPDNEGFINVTDMFGGHSMKVLKNIWDSWRDIEFDDEDVVTPDALADLDGTERQMLSEAEQSRVGRGSAIISGLSVADIGD